MTTMTTKHEAVQKMLYGTTVETEQQAYYKEQSSPPSNSVSNFNSKPMEIYL